MPAGAVDVGKREQRGQQGLVGVLVDAGDGDEGAVGERDADRLGLAAGGAEVRVVPEAAVDARGLQAGAAELAGAARDGERRDDEVARLHGRDVGADLLDDADELVADRTAGLVGRGRVVRVQVAAADAGAGHAHERVGGLLDGRVGGVDDADVAGAVDVGGSHDHQYTACVPFAGVPLVPGTARASLPRRPGPTVEG